MVIVELVILIKLYAETVLILAGLCYHHTRAVALCSDSSVLDLFAVDDDIAWIVFFAFSVLDEILPLSLAHLNVYLVNVCLLEEIAVEKLSVLFVVNIAVLCGSACLEGIALSRAALYSACVQSIACGLIEACRRNKSIAELLRVVCLEYGISAACKSYRVVL